MSKSTMSLRKDPFRPALANLDVEMSEPLMSTALDENIICYTLPNNASRDFTLDAAFYCALACTSDVAPLSQWKNLVVTYMNILIPGIAKKVPKGIVKTVRVTAANMHTMKNIFDTVQELGKPEGYQISPNAFEAYFIDGNLPRPRPDVACPQITHCRREKPLYAHLSLLIFLAGKFINDSNRTAITNARPQALIEKYLIEATAILTGPARISNHGHLMIYQSFLEMSAFTAVCFKEFTKYTGSGANLYQNIISVNVMLLRFANMQHAAIVNKFLKSYPWAADMLELKQSFNVYENSVKTLVSIKPAYQPYVKLIYGDKSGIFPRKEMGPLIACAVEVEKETNITLQNYYSDDQYSEIVDKFKRLRTQRQSGFELTTAIHQPDENDDESDNSDEEMEDPMDLPANLVVEDTSPQQ